MAEDGDASVPPQRHQASSDGEVALPQANPDADVDAAGIALRVPKTRINEVALAVARRSFAKQREKFMAQRREEQQCVHCIACVHAGRLFFVRWPDGMGWLQVYVRAMTIAGARNEARHTLLAR
jgi:hypothetical protein